jgi:hypothetical protein
MLFAAELATVVILAGFGVTMAKAVLLKWTGPAFWAATGTG